MKRSQKYNSKFKNFAFLIIILLFAFCFFNFRSYAQQNPSPQQKISLDIKGMDVVDVLKMVATRAGLNLVIGKNVTGRVTLFLKDVDVWDAFEIVLLANDLAYEKKAEIINVMTQRDYELLYGERFQDKKQAKIIQLKYAKAADLSRALNQIKTNIGKIVVDEGSNTLALIDAPEKIKEMEDFIKKTDLPLQTRIFSLNYAPVDKLNTKLQEAITKGVGSIKIDERTNKIAVTDYPAKLEEIAKIIAAFDEKTPQVLIDAQVIEVTPSDQFQMGVDWNYWIQKYFDIKFGVPINSTKALILGTATTTPTGKGDYKGIVDLLRTIGDTKILSSPRVMAINNQEAKILVGTKEAYVTQTTSQGGSGTEVTADQVNFVDVGIKLYVTPTINRDNFVTMKIRPEISSSDYKDFGTTSTPKLIPIVTTSESETTVVVKDGITIIIAGLRKDKRTKTVKKIPLFGDIPGIGFLFRSTDDKIEKSDLVILLTPHIMSGETPFSDFSEVPPKDGAVAKMFRGRIVTEKIKDNSPDYYNLIAERVKALCLFGQRSGLKGMVEVLFTLDSKGQLKHSPLVLSSSNQNLNNVVIECIKSASPFPAFPKELRKTEENFHITLEYE